MNNDPSQPASIGEVAGPPLWTRKQVDRGPQIRLLVNGSAIAAFEGEPVGIALAAAGLLELRRSPELAGARGMFCLMGACQECVVEIDGEMRPSCVTGATDGMQVTTNALHRHGGRDNRKAAE